MNTKNLKSYAPKARRQFIEAVTKRAAYYGIYENKVADITFDGSAALIEGRAFTKEIGEKRQQILKRIEEKGFDLFVRELAYTWFNRLAAIRYMELHDYLEHGLRVLSRPDNKAGFEILDHAVDVCETLSLDRNKIVDLKLAGDKEEDLYRELLLGQCHYLHKVMPFLFEAIDDATELLLPDNLTKTDSIIHDLVGDVPEEDWNEIEVIGWLYQFYISEHKDSVMGKVIKPEDIPAATQLFTPSWIVKYLVQNSVGHQWLLKYPESNLKVKLDYYIGSSNKSDLTSSLNEVETDEPLDPENIKIIDPACGSGHILIEAYGLIRDIYLERGYRLREIPGLILSKNIYGLDIDDRAAQLAGLSLIMKAREDDRRIFERIRNGGISLNVLSLNESSNLDVDDLWRELEINDDELFEALKVIMIAFESAKNFGSLITISESLNGSLKELQKHLTEISIVGSLLQKPSAMTLLPYVRQAVILSQKYDSVIANPPYMGSKGMNPQLKTFAKKTYPESKADLFSMFMERSFSLLKPDGFNAQVNMHSWMFLSSFQKLRENLLKKHSLLTMCHLGARAFSQISGEVVQTTAWVFNKRMEKTNKPVFVRLVDGSEIDKVRNFHNKDLLFSNHSQDAFTQIPGSPVAYWVSDATINAFKGNPAIGDLCTLREGIHTGFNDGYVRHWAEINFDDISFLSETQEDFDSALKTYAPYNKGGAFRKWYGNNEQVIAWSPHKREQMSRLKGHVRPSQNLYFLPSIEWSLISSGRFGARFSPAGTLNDVASHYLVSDSEENKLSSMALFNSKLGQYFLSLLNPTLNFSSGVVSKIPFVESLGVSVNVKVKAAIDIVKRDWDSQETSWHFKKPLLLNFEELSLEERVESVCQSQQRDLEDLVNLESDINDILIKQYQLEEDVDAKVNWADITILSNPYATNANCSSGAAYKFRSTSQVKQLLSYAVGNMMGRYSLNSEGLVYAREKNIGFEEVTSGLFVNFPFDDDGILPLTDQEWFSDDVTNRFCEFVKLALPSDKADENIEFISHLLSEEYAKLKKTGSATSVIRSYFSTYFYKDHLKLYKKKPIYWLFSSGKEKAFECLVYLHRYNEGTLSRMRTEYVTPLMGKFDSYSEQLLTQIADSSSSQQRQLEKEIKLLERKQEELRAFDESLKHFAEQRISIDLDDGIKVNYGKFGHLLAEVKSVTGKAPGK